MTCCITFIAGETTVIYEADTAEECLALAKGLSDDGWINHNGAHGPVGLHCNSLVDIEIFTGAIYPNVHVRSVWWEGVKRYRVHK